MYFDPSIHFTLPIGNTLVHETTNGAACLVDRPVHIQQQPGRRDPLEMLRSARASAGGGTAGW